MNFTSGRNVPVAFKGCYLKLRIFFVHPSLKCPSFVALATSKSWKPIVASQMPKTHHLASWAHMEGGCFLITPAEANQVQKKRNCNQDSPSNFGQQLESKLEFSVLSATGRCRSGVFNSAKICQDTHHEQARQKYQLSTWLASDSPASRWSSKNRKRIGCHGTTVTVCASKLKGNTTLNSEQRQMYSIHCWVQLPFRTLQFHMAECSLCVPLVLSNTILWDNTHK